MSNTAPAQAQGHAAPAPAAQPFRASTQPTILATGINVSQAMETSTVDLPQIQIPPSNILRCLYLEVNAAYSGNTATVAFASGDAPLNVFSSLSLADSGGTSIFGTFDSWTAAMAQKWFGYVNSADPRNSAVYSATTGSSATGGFNFVLRIPVEVASRTGVGSLSNQSTNSPLTLSLTLNKSSAIYSTAPTTLPTVTVTMRLGGYWRGQNGSASQTPKAFGTTAYVNRSTVMAVNGAATVQAPPVGFGNPFRNLMLVNYATGAARSDADMANPVEIDFRGNRLLQASQNLWRQMMSEWFGYTGTTLDAAGGQDTGTYVLPSNHDFGLAPGDDQGYGWLNTNVGDSLQVLGSWNASSTLYFVTNYVAVKGAGSAVQPGA
jgi:hypothetical protein